MNHYKKVKFVESIMRFFTVESILTNFKQLFSLDKQDLSQQ